MSRCMYGIGQASYCRTFTFRNRVCRVCGKEKNLVDEYYLSRKNPALASSYSYECKECTVKRTVEYNKEHSSSVKSQYLKTNYGLTFEVV